MQTKGRIMLMVIAGGYLAYLGGGLVTDAMKEKPENYILYTVVGRKRKIFSQRKARYPMNQME